MSPIADNDLDNLQAPQAESPLFQRPVDDVQPVNMLGYRLPLRATVSYNERPDAETVVLLHGLGGTRGDWSAAFQSPALADYHLIAIDLPGHGGTPPLDIYTIPPGLLPTMGALVHHAVTALLPPRSSSPVHLVAQGGGLAVAHASALTDTDRAGRVVSVHGHLLPSDCAPTTTAIAAQPLDRYRHQGHQQLVRRLNDGTEAGRRQSWALMRANSGTVHRLAAALTRACDDTELRTWWNNLPDRSWIHGVHAAPPISHQSFLRGVQVVAIPDAGRRPLVDNPDDVLGAVRQHLALALTSSGKRARG